MGKKEKGKRKKKKERRREDLYPSLIAHTCGSRACREAEGKKEQRKREREKARQQDGGNVKHAWHQRWGNFIFRRNGKRLCQSLIDEDSIVVNGRSNSVVASTAWQHTGERNRRSSGTKRTLEREIALIGEKAFLRLASFASVSVNKQVIAHTARTTKTKAISMTDRLSSDHFFRLCDYKQNRLDTDRAI